MLMGNHRLVRQGRKTLAAATVVASVIIGVTAIRGGAQAASSLDAMAQSSLVALPLCDGVPHPDQVAGEGTHEISSTTLEQALSVTRFSFKLPGQIPDWVTCQVVDHLEWSDREADSGGITLWLYGASYPKAPAMEFFVAPPPLKARPLDAPLDTWGFEPIDGRQSWFQFDLPDGAPALWTEIAWFDTDGSYYRLRGSFTLDTALEIGDSIQAANSGG